MEDKKGFALLYAILLTGAVLTVGVVLMNIITKQLVFSSLNRNSEVSYYYVANSGRDCLQYYFSSFPETFYVTKKVGGVKIVEFNQTATIKCFDGNSIGLKSTGGGQPVFESDVTTVEDNGINRKVRLSIQLNENCLLRNASCTAGSPEKLIDTAKAVMTSDGYSGENIGTGRTTKRTAISVVRSF